MHHWAESIKSYKKEVGHCVHWHLQSVALTALCFFLNSAAVTFSPAWNPLSYHSCHLSLFWGGKKKPLKGNIKSLNLTKIVFQQTSPLKCHSLFWGWAESASGKQSISNCIETPLWDRFDSACLRPQSAILATPCWASSYSSRAFSFITILTSRRYLSSVQRKIKSIKWETAFFRSPWTLKHKDYFPSPQEGRGEKEVCKLWKIRLLA